MSQSVYLFFSSSGLSKLSASRRAYHCRQAKRPLSAGSVALQVWRAHTSQAGKKEDRAASHQMRLKAVHRQLDPQSNGPCRLPPFQIWRSSESVRTAQPGLGAPELQKRVSLGLCG